MAVSGVKSNAEIPIDATEVTFWDFWGVRSEIPNKKRCRRLFSGALKHWDYE